MRTAEELAGVVAANPFPDAKPNQLLVIFLDAAPAGDTLGTIRHRASEELRLGKREVWIHYGEGIGTSKLVVPAAKTGTARNLNTVAKLAEMAAELSSHARLG